MATAAKHSELSIKLSRMEEGKIEREQKWTRETVLYIVSSYLTNNGILYNNGHWGSNPEPLTWESNTALTPPIG